jgi:hypothetical protein
VIFVTEESAIQRIKELDLRGAVLFEKAKEEALDKAGKRDIFDFVY